MHVLIYPILILIGMGTGIAIGIRYTDRNTED